MRPRFLRAEREGEGIRQRGRVRRETLPGDWRERRPLRSGSGADNPRADAPGEGRRDERRPTALRQGHAPDGIPVGYRVGQDRVRQGRPMNPGTRRRNVRDAERPARRPNGRDDVRPYAVQEVRRLFLIAYYATRLRPATRMGYAFMEGTRPFDDAIRPEVHEVRNQTPSLHNDGGRVLETVPTATGKTENHFRS